MSNPLWDYSTSHYAREGVAETCLALQDEYGMDVNLLLYAAWLATDGFVLERQHVLALLEQVTRWRQEVVVPLRTLRRRWKGYEAAEELRRRLQALELRAEQVQQEQMLAFFRTNPLNPVGTSNVEENLCLMALEMAPEGQSWRPAIGKLAGLLSD